jgi:hypothetical protein
MICRIQSFAFGFFDEQVQKQKTSQQELQGTAADFLMHMERSGSILAILKRNIDIIHEFPQIIGSYVVFTFPDDGIETPILT